MRYEIVGSTMQALRVYLDDGETLFTESGAMAWMSDSIQMDSNFRGGVLGTLGRWITGEKLTVNTFTARRATGEVAFAPHVPGKIVAVEMAAGHDLIAQKQSFLAAEVGVELRVHFRRKLWSGLFGGEGFILQRITGRGTAFFEVDGEVVEMDLAPAQRLRVDTGHVAMFEASVDFDITFVRGIKNWILGGDGLFLTTLRGPGRVWLQTLPFTNLVGRIAAAVGKGEKE